MELSAAIASFDRSRVADRVANAEQQRKRVLAEFPLPDWPTLEVERYALGCGPGTYCRLMEFETVDLGGIGGGVAPASTLSTGAVLASGSQLRSSAQTSKRGGSDYEASATSWRANQQLGALVKQFPELSAWEPHELMQFLYDYFDPRERGRAIWNIAPGEQAKYWQDCLHGNYICVGWDELGDLSQVIPRPRSCSISNAP